MLGNIRVYCRIRPFLPGQNKRSTTIDFVGENGELLIANPSKQGKDGHRMFKFNKVYSPAATQGLAFVAKTFLMLLCAEFLSKVAPTYLSVSHIKDEFSN